MDCDFICCRPLAPLLGLAACFDYVGHLEWDGGFMGNFLVARAGSPIMRSSADHALEVFRERPEGGGDWLTPNRGSLERAIETHRWQATWMNLPTHLIEPVHLCDADWFCQEPEPNEKVARFTCFGYMTSNHTLRAQLSQLSEHELLYGNRRISHLFRHALDMPIAT